MYFGKVRLSTPDDTETTVEDRAAFYGTLFASTCIPPSKEEYKLSELRALFQIFLRFACLERDVVFDAVLRMCADYDRGLTEYSENRRSKSRPRLAISWLKSLRSLHDPDIGMFARKCSTFHGRQEWYFEDFVATVAMRTTAYAVLNALRWILKDNKPGLYMYDALMKVDVVREYSIYAVKIQDLCADAGKSFVEKWKGPACDNFKKQREQVSLIPQSIVRFMEEKIREGPLPSEPVQGIAEFQLQSELHRNCKSCVQIVQSSLEHSVGKLGESCLWMVDCRSSTKDGDGRGATEVPKILEHILRWMSGVTRWNAIFMLALNDCALDIGTMLTSLDGSDDIVIQEGTYTFSRQSSDAKTYIVHGARKLYFRCVGGLLFLMRYPRESDWRPNASLDSDAEWPTSWMEPIKEWATCEWSKRGRCARTVMSIVQHSAPAEWMVAVVGLTYMVPSLVDHDMHRITVFEGNQDIRLHLLSWVEEKEGSSRA
jgi:hypothetical protein